MKRALGNIGQLRNLATHVAHKEQHLQSLLVKSPPQVSKLPNGIIVASVENNSPVTHLAVAYRAGSRNEITDEQLGVTHCIRSAVALATQKTSALLVTRNIQQAGGYLNCTVDRENLIYSIDVIREGRDFCLNFLREVSTEPAFKHWQLDDNVSLIRNQLAYYKKSPHLEVIELLHAAAYRNALNRSVYMPTHKVGSHSDTVVKNYFNSFCHSGNMAVVAVGMAHDSLVAQLKKFHVAPAPANMPPKEKAVYRGGEIFKPNGNSTVHVAVAVEAAGKNSHENIACDILKYAIATPSTIAYSNHEATNKLSQAASKASPNPFAVHCIHHGYSDSGIFGFHLCTEASVSDKVVPAVVKAMRTALTGGITDKDIERGRNLLKLDVAHSLENGRQFLNHMTDMCMLTGFVFSVEDILKEIDKIKVADIQAVAKKLAAGKPSMAVVGNIINMPHLSELLK